MTAMTQQKNFGWKEGKRIAAAALLGFSLWLAPAQAQELPPLDSFWCVTCDSYPEFRSGDFSRLGEPIIDPACDCPFPGNRILQSRLLAHGAWPEDLYQRNSGVFRGAAGRVARLVAQGWTPLHEALRDGSSSHPLSGLNPAHLDRLLDAWPDALNSGLRNNEGLAGWTPLHFAAYHARVRPGAVERLLKRGVSVDPRVSAQRFFLGATPLLAAFSLEAFEALRAAGADIRARQENGFTVLHRAAVIGDAAAVGSLIAAKLDPNAATDFGSTPLHNAGSLEAFEALRAAGADIRARQENGFTVLHRAAAIGDAAAVRSLIAAKLDPNAATDFGNTPLHYAGSLEAFEALRADGADLSAIEAPFAPDAYAATRERREGAIHSSALRRAMQQVGRFGDTAWFERLRAANPAFYEAMSDYRAWRPYRTLLYYAAERNEDLAAVEALLAEEAKVDEDSRPYRLQQALGQAALSNGNPAVVEALLAAGADVNATDTARAWAPLSSAAYNDAPRAAEIVQALLAAGADLNADRGRALYNAASNQTPRAPEIVRVLLAAGASVDGVEPSDGERALRPVYVAAMVQNLATLDALLAARANTNVEGSTAHYSLLADVLSRGRFDCAYGPVADRLRSAGARAVRFTESGEVPFTPGPQVAECDSVSAEIRALIDAGADLDVQDERGETALHRAAAAGRVADLQALVAAGAEVDAASRGGGLRALHFAIWRQAGLATVTALLEAGADVNARDSRGGTALHWAARLRQVEPAVVEALLAAGAEVHARDNLGQTALAYATRANIANEAVATLLRAAGED